MGARGVWVDPESITLARVGVSGLPVVNAVLDRLGFHGLVAGHLGHPGSRRRLAAAEAIGVLVRALALGRQPLYGLGSWASGYDPVLLGLSPTEGHLVNDDRVGRALDALFGADRASLTTALSLAAVVMFDISLDELHNDSTSICLYGAYRRSEQAGEDRAPRPARGHSKDHRPDLKQLVWILTTSADGAVPITYRLADGNTEDSTTHIATWESCRGLAGRADFLYIADCKLATRDNMNHIAGEGGRFLTVMPRSRKEDEAGRAWLAREPVAWVEVARRPGRAKTDPDEAWWAVAAPDLSLEGYRIVWVRSSSKQAQDAAARTEHIARAAAALSVLAGTLASPRCRLKTAVAVTDAAKAVIAKSGASRWVNAIVAEEVTSHYRQERRGRPGPNTRYRQIDHSTFTLTWFTDAAQVGLDAASDGCFPLITNDHEMTEAALLAAYKAQPHLERRHAVLKGILEAAPIELKSETRIDAFGFCLYAALLVHALIERELRRAMADAGISELPLYYEDRACTAPTATRVLEVLDPLARTTVLHRGQVLTVVAPALSPLQNELLSLLGTPLGPYGAEKSERPNSAQEPWSRCGT